MSSEPRPYKIKTKGQCRRRCAELLLRQHPLHQSQLSRAWSKTPSARIVCISDTHNKRPEIPPGDVLIHAGDLSDNGSFDEIQSGLDWFAAQPHRYKILIAGNHDVLLDESFLARYPERLYGSSKTLHDLVWPDNVVYLNNSSTTLDIANPAINHDDAPAKRLNSKPTASRKLRIYGSPYTPEYVPSAFQYARNDTTFWENKIPSDTDIVVTHGPPRLHLDAYSGIPRGCVLLGEEIARVRPRLHVFGHIHAGYGKEDVVFDSARRTHDDIVNSSHDDAGWRGLLWYWALGRMIVSAIWCRTKVACLGRKKVEMEAKVTTMVNASVVAWSDARRENEWRNEAIVVEI